jgi:PAS domain S-box-containing protein
MPDSKGSRILIVEDEPAIAKLEKARLEHAGYTAVVASTTREARQIVEQGGVDLVVLDNHLPGNVIGLDFYLQLKQAGYHIPVILVTGFSDEETAIKALRAGVRDYLTKSAAYLNYLAEVVERVLREVRMEQQLVASKARLASILAAASDPLIIVERDERITLFSPAAEELFRCSAGDALGQPVSQFITQKLRGVVSGELVTVRHPEGRVFVSTSQRVLSGRRADGSPVTLAARIAEADADGERYLALALSDANSRTGGPSHGG